MPIKTWEALAKRIFDIVGSAAILLLRTYAVGRAFYGSTAIRQYGIMATIRALGSTDGLDPIPFNCVTPTPIKPPIFVDRSSGAPHPTRSSAFPPNPRGQGWQALYLLQVPHNVCECAGHPKPGWLYFQCRR